ncbi:MAG: hypothetical protein NMK33_02285 [Candidatus Cardinium sp.]|uniref:hypothetical protein n=1 Tax=Cardinium endosymbiont of Dermatophagoides farinae TaxID=2597823 RepID=UPI0011825723|nr:hypothetical protein [Cardinium endosymbiont of Dermatophagoides farinae]TSJ81307.1 hypothetical protein FPG78_04950 [Cardinium endosymbiont of Dermatophagoides farinae]UWW97370.1 MAG: hypothetical protein NMK33_02285 [Candidatus Cardinium sp.]
MKRTRLPKRNKIAIVVAIFSFFLYSATNAHAKNIKSKKPATILQKIKELCKQKISKTDSLNDNPYINLLAYDLVHQTGHNVSLMPYMQQANTQINNDFLPIATKTSGPPNHNTPSNDVATDALLEELLGVHTFTQPIHAEQERSIWQNFSFDFSIGAGLIYYTNGLEHMRLLQRKNQNHDYFFVTKTNEVYKPNWFHHTLNMVSNFNESNCVKGDDAQNSAFQGKEWGIPITLGIQYIFWQRLLVGVGKEVVFNATNRLLHNDDHIKHKAYIMPKKWSVQGRWFAKCGWYAFNGKKHRFFGDIRLFHIRHLGSMFARVVTFGPYLHEALAYNFGLGYEQQLTGYLSWITRLSVELQSFKQFTSKKSCDYNIAYKQLAIYLQVGLSIRANPLKHFKNKKDQNENHRFNDISKLKGLQNLLDLD